MFREFLIVLAKLFGLVLLYFADISNMFYAILFFIAMDWITGIYSSYKFRKEKHWFKASKLKKSIEKITLYMLAIAIANVLEKELIEVNSIDSIVAGYIALTEIKSVYENMSRILGVEIFNDIYQLLRQQFQNKHNLNLKNDSTKKNCPDC